jgi:adenylate cyclase
VPSENTEQRKLAAIMFTDMVGYSALSQRDDALAQQLLEEHRQLLRAIFSRFHGIEIKTIGDAFLIEFSSALEAAQSAIEIQRALAKRNHDVTPDRRIELKIGIHIGDVVHRGGDVYGDGVNIASRIEPLAGAGGICVSMDVERQIRNALEARFEKLASTELKNIKLPMQLFRIVLPWETGAKPDERVGRSSKRVPIIGTALAAVLVLALTGWWLIQRSGNPIPTPTGQPRQEQPQPKPAEAESTTPAPKPIPTDARAMIAGTWTGKMKVGGIEYDFELTVNSEATSLMVVRKLTGAPTKQFACPTTVSGNTLSWRPGWFANGVQVGTVAWTLTPNADDQTALVRATTPDGVSNAATFRKESSH